MATNKCSHDVPAGAKFCPECGQIADLGAVLVSRIPAERWPQPTAENELAGCGKTGRLVEKEYPGQKFPWVLYEQSGHAASLVVIADSVGDERRICLVKQWRPVDTDCVELPAGNIGVQSPQEMFDKLLAELSEEVGEVEIEEIAACKGFAHDVGREIAAGGGPKCFFPFLVWVKAPTAPKTFVEGDETTHSKWYTGEEIRDMVADGQIGDMVTIFFLVCAGVIKVGDLEWMNITHLIATE
ncbi:MAG: hypothetical protein BWY43_00356 [candidate division WS2 bacterium ADurb.Bin280]|uniref:Nudix hydrolase domain-containing protein n=1 Tax=candidate division WS2 bacterium ADurb.Bin280 TaxID=1852829 RepID=A0A1V5SDZ0_9BACT|nr:MAG: hypothetical protein BWY43_00356 [candidate division WS2 bacterium ADurb.Bin280]